MGTRDYGYRMNGQDLVLECLVETFFYFIPDIEYRLQSKRCPERRVHPEVVEKI